jgi:hypothetical protein
MIKVYIENEEVVCDKSFTINEEFLSTSSVILNNVYPKSWETTHNYVNDFYLPKDYSKCEIYNDDTLLFEGVVRNTGNISLNPREPKLLSLEVLDYKCLLSEGKTLDLVIANKTIAQAISIIVEQIQEYGFEVGVIDLDSADDVIGTYSTLDKTAYDVFQYIGEISQAKWFTKRESNGKLSINFYDSYKIPRANNIEYNKEYWEQNNIVDLTYNYNTRDYRNSQVINSSGVFSDSLNSENQIYDGYSTNLQFSLPIGKIVDIQVNDSSVSYATQTEKELGITADFYYSVNNNIIEINTDLQQGDKIELQYYPFVKGRQIVENEQEISRISNQISRLGRISRYENRNDVTDNNELIKIGQSYIEFKGKAEIELKLTTINNDILNIGQQVYFEAPINDLKSDYLVKKKTIKVNKTGDYENIFYEYKLSNTYNGEQAINYFDNQRRKNEGNLEEGQFITRNVDIQDTALIVFDNLVVEEAQENSTLDCKLDSPL